jgi:hypothetical protein
MAVLIIQAMIAMTCIIAYVVLTINGYDGTALLGILGGQAIGGGVQALGSRG